MKTRLKLLLSLAATLIGVVTLIIPFEFRFLGCFPFLIGLFHTLKYMGDISNSYLNVGRNEDNKL